MNFETKEKNSYQALDQSSPRAAKMTLGKTYMSNI